MNKGTTITVEIEISDVTTVDHKYYGEHVRLQGTVVSGPEGMTPGVKIETRIPTDGTTVLRTAAYKRENGIVAAEPVEASEVNLDDLTVPELKELAAKHDVDLDGAKRKADIKSVLAASLPANATA